MAPRIFSRGVICAILTGVSARAASDIYVRTPDSILKVSPGGNISTVIQDPADLASGTDIAAYSDGTVFFTGTNVLYSYQPGEAVANLGGLHTGSNEIWSGLALMPNKTPYVLARNIPFESIRVYNQSPGLSSSSNDTIIGLTADPSGNLYYMNGGFVEKVTQQGSISVYHAPTFFSGVPRSIAADSSGDVFVSGNYDPVGQGIFEVAPDGTVTTVLSGTGIGGPLAEDLSGDLYWNNNGTLEMMAPGGTFTMVASGLPANARIAAATVPEPGLGLFAIGGALLFGGRRLRVSGPPFRGPSNRCRST